MLFIVVAVIFGVIQKHVGKMNEWVKAVVAIALLVAMFAVGYETSNLYFKDSMDLHHHGILIPCIRTSDVAFNAA